MTPYTNNFDEDDDVRSGVPSADFMGSVDDRDRGHPASGSSDPDALGGGDVDLFDAGFHRGGDELLLVGVVDGEEDPELPSSGPDELAQTAQRHLSNSRKGSRKKADLISFNEEDFDPGPQRDAFIIIRSFKNALFGTSSTPDHRWSAIEWFFTILDNDKDVTFQLCCQALGARIDVLRLRIHYEFFLRWWLSPREFPFATVPIPDIIDGEIAYVAGEIGRDLATVAWNKPGITTSELLSSVGKGQEARRALSRLEEKLILCDQTSGNWYLTGRNPYLMRKQIEANKGYAVASLGGSFHWSRLL